MKNMFGALCCCFAVLACSTAQADLVVGDTVGIDFGQSTGGGTGGATTANFNNINSFSGTIAAGSVFGTDNVADPNLAFSWNFVTVNSAIDNAGSEDNSEFPGQPASIPDTALQDWLGFRDVNVDEGGGSITLTLSGLDDSLIYDVVVGAANDVDNENADTSWSVDGGSALVTDASVAANAYVTFSGLTTGGDGTLVLTGLAGGTSGIAPELGFVSAMTITAVGVAVPEPSSLAFLGLGVLGLAARRRR